jgi:hypothetical protein
MPRGLQEADGRLRRSGAHDLAAEEAEYRRLVNVERARLKPEAKAEQKKWIAREGAKLGPDGERIVKAALTRRTLSGAWALQFDDDDLGMSPSTT